MTKKIPIDKEKQSLFQKIKNPLPKSIKSIPENEKKLKPTSKSRSDLSASNRYSDAKTDKIHHVRRVIHVNQKYLNSSNNSINGVINHIQDKKRNRSMSSNNKRHIHSHEYNTKSRLTRNDCKYPAEKERKNYYSDIEHEKIRRARKCQLQKKPVTSQKHEVDILSDPQTERRRGIEKYSSNKNNYSDIPPSQKRINASKSSREIRTGINMTVKNQKSTNNRHNNNNSRQYETCTTKSRNLEQNDYGEGDRPSIKLKNSYNQIRPRKNSIPNGFFNSSDECSEGSTKKYLYGSESPIHSSVTDSDSDNKYKINRRKSLRKPVIKYETGSEIANRSPTETTHKCGGFSNVITIDTDDSESFIVQNQRDSERYAHKREYKQTLAGYVDELNLQRKKIDELQNEKETLQRELNKVKMDFESLLPRYKSLKKSSKDLLTVEMERKSLNYKNKQLQQKVDTLSKIIGERDEKQVNLETQLMEAQREFSKATKEAEELRIELNHYRQQFQRQLNEKEKFYNMKKLEQEKDLKIRLMHNEIIELKGNVRVIARFKMEAENQIYHFSGMDTVTLKHKLVDTGHNYFQSKKPRRIYTFNRVFRPGATQEDVFDEVSPYVTSCIDGYNVCVMTYGQTGSGKTYTMKGSDDSPGIIPRAVEQMFNECNDRTVWNYKLYISILQIYNENMTDLLTDAINRVYIQDDGSTVFIKGLQEFRVKTKDDIEHYIKLGRKRSSTAKTVLNVDSSRSHFVVMLRVFGCSTMKNHETQGILTLCDLAGFERFTAKDPYGRQATETKFISKSLTVLARVFDSLRSKQRSIPFRESKLTHLLKPSLSGDAKCVLILTLSSSSNNVESTVRSLDFGMKAIRTSLGAARKNVTEINLNKEKGDENEESNSSL